MKIGIEAESIFSKKKQSKDYTVLELIKALQINDSENEYYIFVRKGEDNECLKETANFKIIEVSGFTYINWKQFILPLYAKKYKLDFLHCTSNSTPIFYKGNTVLTLHESRFLEKNHNKDKFNLFRKVSKYLENQILSLSIKKTKHIIAISEFERERIMNVFDLKENKISVVYNALSNQFDANNCKQNLNEINSKYNLPDKFIFYIGNTHPENNIFNTIKAYKNYCNKSFENLPLVIANVTEDYLAFVLKSTDCYEVRNNICLTGNVLNTDLPIIYSRASLFLYPTINESFCIPLLESMASGTPVIASNSCALIEIAGDAAAFVDPLNEKNIGNAMTHVLTDFNRAQELVKKGFERISKFNWNVSAIKLVEVYKTKLATNQL